MSNELNFASGVTGQTVTARLLKGGTVVATGIAVPAVSGQPGFYSGNVPGGTDAGSYQVLFVISGVVKAAGELYWDGANEIQLADPVQAYHVLTNVYCPSISGVWAYIKVQLLNASKQLINLAVIDPDATCTVTVIRDGGATQFILSTDDMGPPTDEGWFEMEYANPNFVNDRGYTAITTVVAAGATYSNRIEFFNVWG